MHSPPEAENNSRECVVYRPGLRNRRLTGAEAGMAQGPEKPSACVSNSKGGGTKNSTVYVPVGDISFFGGGGGSWC